MGTPQTGLCKSHGLEAAAQPQGAPGRYRLPKVHLQGQTSLSCCPHHPKAGAGTTLVAALTSWRSGGLPGGAGGAGGKENTSLSAVISPRQGSHHQLPAEQGPLSLTLYSWRWRGADGPAWPRFQPDCQGGVGRATGCARSWNAQEESGAASLPLPRGPACMWGEWRH